MNDPRNQRLRELAEQACAQENCRLYDLEFISGSQGRGRVVRVYIDRLSPEVPHVGIEECTHVSRSLSLLLDVEDAVSGSEYHLEVSTPGLDRVLKEPWHFESVVGKKIEIKTRSGMDQWNPVGPDGQETRVKGRLRLNGILEKVEDHWIYVCFEGAALKIPIGEIEKARVVFEIEAPKAKPGQAKPGQAKPGQGKAKPGKKKTATQ